ncbi:MAG: glycosyltransferase [Hahellaceae bacterium]|nr:glycosyltransferase [Hahellaceae bacterium]
MDKTKSIKLLYAIPESFPTTRSDIAVLFGKYLPRDHVYSDVVASSTPERAAAEWTAGECFVKSVSGGAFKKRIASAIHILRTVVALNLEPYQAVQVRDMPIVGSLLLLLCKARHIPFFFWMSYPISEAQIELARQRGLRSGFWKWAFPWLFGRLGKFFLRHVILRYSQHLFVQSDVMKQELMELGVNPSKMTPVPMGVDIEAIQSFSSAGSGLQETYKDSLKLVYLGTLDRPREIETLLKMCALLIEEFPTLKLFLVGDSEDKEHVKKLKQTAKEFSIEDSVVWTGWLPMSQAWEYVQIADITLSPYPRGKLLDSASPTKVAEYMALNKVTVANDQPDQVYTLESSGSGICVPYTAENFANAVRKLLNSPELRRTMADKGYTWVNENRSYACLAPSLANIYRELLATRSH